MSAVTVATTSPGILHGAALRPFDVPVRFLAPVPTPATATSRARNRPSRRLHPRTRRSPSLPRRTCSPQRRTRPRILSTLLKYNEPPEARKPLVGWRLYVFKGEKQVGASLPPLPPCLFLQLAPTHLQHDRLTCCWVFSSDLLHIHRQSAYLIGRDRTVTDIPIEHPSCSKQHAVIQCT